MAEKEPEFANKYNNSGEKTIEKCCEYICSEIGKKRDGAKCVAMTAEEVCGIAVHYYDEEVVAEVTPDNDVQAVAVGKVESVGNTEQPTPEPPKKRGRKKKEQVATQPQSDPEPQAQEPPEQSASFEIPDLDIPLF